jgi:RNA polymerase sigma-70 factor (ECF subfamily)
MAVTIPPCAATSAAGGQLDDAALVERAYRIAHRAALGVVGSRDAADDVAQEVAIEAMRGRRTVRDPDRVDGWLYRVATRTAIRHAKRDRRRRERELRHHGLAPGPTAAPEPGLDGSVALLAGMPERQRAAMTLRYVLDLSDVEIARALGCREVTVRSLLTRGRATLRDRLAPDPSTTTEEPTCS